MEYWNRYKQIQTKLFDYLNSHGGVCGQSQQLLFAVLDLYQEIVETFQLQQGQFEVPEGDIKLG
jgi:hypothetical protein